MLRISLFWLLFVGVCGGILSTTYAANRTLIDVETFPSSEKELVHIHFDRDFEGVPSTEFFPGAVRIYFPNTQRKKEMEFMRVNDGFIRAIRVSQAKQSSILEIEFADSSLKPINQVDFLTKDQILVVSILKKAPPILEEETGLRYSLPTQPTKTVEPTQDSFLNYIDEEQTPEMIPEEQWANSIAQMLVGLLIVLAVIYLLLWFYNKYITTRFSQKKGQYQIKILSSYHLGPKQKVVILEVGEEAYVCGITPNQINLISSLSREDALKTHNILKKDTDVSAGKIRAEYLASQQQAEKTSSEEITSPEPTPKPNFGDELVGKVKQLRRID